LKKYIQNLFKLITNNSDTITNSTVHLHSSNWIQIWQTLHFLVLPGSRAYVRVCWPMTIFW